MTPEKHADRIIDNYTSNGLGDPTESTDHAVVVACALKRIMGSLKSLYLDCLTDGDDGEHTGNEAAAALLDRFPWLGEYDRCGGSCPLCGKSGHDSPVADWHCPACNIRWDSQDSIAEHKGRYCLTDTGDGSTMYDTRPRPGA